METDTRAHAGGATSVDPLSGHLLDGRYRVFHGGQLIAEVPGVPPTETINGPRSIAGRQVMHEKAAKKRVTESLNR